MGLPNGTTVPSSDRHYVGSCAQSNCTKAEIPAEWGELLDRNLVTRTGAADLVRPGGREWVA